MDARGFVTPAAPLTETPPEPWRAVLLDAADYLEKNGWLQDRWDRREDDARCVMGAISMSCARRRSPVYSEATQRLAYSLGLPSSSHAIGWNNTEGRTAAEVTAALRECARS